VQGEQALPTTQGDTRLAARATRAEGPDGLEDPQHKEVMTASTKDPHGKALAPVNRG
jgi:hypothetical protein